MCVLCCSLYWSRVRAAGSEAVRGVPEWRARALRLRGARALHPRLAAAAAVRPLLLPLPHRLRRRAPRLAVELRARPLGAARPPKPTIQPEGIHYIRSISIVLISVCSTVLSFAIALLAYSLLHFSVVARVCHLPSFPDLLELHIYCNN